MADAAEQIELARRKKLERQQQVDVLLNHIQHLRATYENVIMRREKLVQF